MGNSANINLLFPPTPALAAASKLAESIAVAGSSTGGETPSAKGTPSQSLRGTPITQEITAATPTSREGMIRSGEVAGTEMGMDNQGTLLSQRVRSPRKSTSVFTTPAAAISPSRRVSGESPRPEASVILGVPRQTMVDSPKPGSPGSALQLAEAAISTGSPTVVPGTFLIQETFSIKGTPSQPTNAPMGVDDSLRKITDDTGELISVQGTPVVIIKETPPTVGTPRSTAGAAPSVGGSVSNTPTRMSKQQTPSRSPRFSVVSGGSPVVLDKEITGSPKITRVDFYFEPNAATATNMADYVDVNGAHDVEGEENVITQAPLDDISTTDDTGADVIPETAIVIDNPNCKRECVSLVEVNFSSAAEGEEGKGRSAEPVKLSDQMQIDANEPAESGQDKEADKVSLIDGGRPTAGDAVEVAPTASPMETISAATAAATTTSGELLTATVISCEELSSTKPMTATPFEESKETTVEVALKVKEEKEPNQREGEAEIEGERAEAKVEASTSANEKGEAETLALGQLATQLSPTREAVSSQGITLSASSEPSTPRRSTRLAAGMTKTPAIAAKKTPATTGKRTPVPPPSFGKGRTPATTIRKTPASRRILSARKGTGAESEEEKDTGAEAETETEVTESEKGDTQKSADINTASATAPTPSARSRTPRTTRPRTSTMKTPATEPKSRTASSAKRSTRKAPATSRAVMTVTSGRKMESVRRPGRGHQPAVEEADATSPSLNSRAARTRQKQVRGTEKGEPHMNGGGDDDSENTRTCTNITIVGATMRTTPSAKRTLEEADHHESTNENGDEGDAAGRRRSTRARTPAKAH